MWYWMIYQICDMPIVEDFIKIDFEELENISIPCLNSDFHLLGKEPMKIQSSLNGGTEFPDFLYPFHVPLFSERLYQRIQHLLQPNIFVSDVKIISVATKEQQPYEIVLPMLIDCVNFEKSRFKPIWEEKIFLHENLIGNAVLFKLAGVSNHGIFFREPLKEILASPEFRGYQIFEV